MQKGIFCKDNDRNETLTKRFAFVCFSIYGNLLTIANLNRAFEVCKMSNLSEITSVAPTQHEVTGNPISNTTRVFTDYTEYISRPSEEIMVAVLIILSAYLSCASVWYQLKHGQVVLLWTNRLCTISALTLFFQSCWFEIDVHGRNLSKVLCQAYNVITLILLVFNKSIVYLVLWIRQHTFFSNPRTVHNTPKTVFVISGVTLVAIIVLPSLQVVFQLLLEFDTTPVGCIALVSEAFVSLGFANPVVYMLFTIFQLVLLGLVLYPIVSHLRHNKMDTTSKIQDTVKRLVICTSICVISDIGFLVYVFIRPRWPSASFMPIVFGFNAVINVVALYASFTDHVERFVPFNLQSTTKKKVNEPMAENVTAQTTA